MGETVRATSSPTTKIHSHETYAALYISTNTVDSLWWSHHGTDL